MRLFNTLTLTWDIHLLSEIGYIFSVSGLEKGLENHIVRAANPRPNFWECPSSPSLPGLLATQNLSGRSIWGDF